MSVIAQDGESVLMMAARKGRTEVVSLLLDAGANTDLQNKVELENDPRVFNTYGRACTHERVSQLITCQCVLCKSPNEECGPTHQLLPVHTFRTTHWELYCTESCALILQCKLYKLYTNLSVKSSVSHYTCLSSHRMESVH